jgi:glycine cleavage system H protein
VNEALQGSERVINDDPYGEGWLIRVRISDPAEAESLMDASAYEAHVESL